MISTLIQQIFFMLGGLTVFMVGMQTMGRSLEKAAGSSLRKLMAKASANRFVGVGTGAIVTAIVNSSSATTVMIVGFVNIGLLTLTQATSIIMGANIGTTLSAFIIALSGSDGFSIASVFAALAFVGLVLQIIGKTDKVKRLGAIFIGIGFIFIGLNFLSSAVDKMVNDEDLGPAIQQIFISLGNGQTTLSPGVSILLFLIGMVLTAILQASSAITGIMITLASSGLISINMAVFVTLGLNIGTCFTSILSSIGTSTNAKRTACIHLMFNVIGSILFMIPLVIWQDDVVALLQFLAPGAVKWQIAIFHLFFNMVTTILLLPFIRQLATLATLIVREEKRMPKKTTVAEFLDDRLLGTPPIAVAQTRQEIDSMGKMAFDNYRRSIHMLLTGDMEEVELFAKTEQTINALNTEIAAYCVKLTTQDLSDRDEKKISSFYRVISDIERIGDYAENIVEYAQKMLADGVSFSDAAKAEIVDVDKKINALFGKIDFAFVNRSLSDYAAISEIEDSIDKATNSMADAHIERMTNGKCSPESGAIYLQLSGNLERIADHMMNIANSVKNYTES